MCFLCRGEKRQAETQAATMPALRYSEQRPDRGSQKGRRGRAQSHSKEGKVYQVGRLEKRCDREHKMCFLGRTMREDRQKRGPRGCRCSDTQSCGLTEARRKDAVVERSVTVPG
ncbi:hypothetical protein NDU88_007581 [Pleurodeles waltl]|uniref:Uncharacterized protein n=1 Tax=Pleurodeles waltl TaxID=8319 RepID=A0AAV7N2F5_PLEWA|nr:hypothetical protein NDU88_007581 [Pleurodeles waltl]